MSDMRYLLVPVADDDALVRAAIEYLRESEVFGPVAEVTIDVMDDGVIRHITNISMKDIADGDRGSV